MENKRLGISRFQPDSAFAIKGTQPAMRRNELFTFAD